LQASGNQSDPVVSRVVTQDQCSDQGVRQPASSRQPLSPHLTEQCEELFLVKRGSESNAEDEFVVAGVPEGVRFSREGGKDHTRRRIDMLAADPEVATRATNRPGLCLSRMDMTRRSPPPRPESKVDLEEVALSVDGGADEGEPLPRRWVLDRLSRSGHNSKGKQFP